MSGIGGREILINCLMRKGGKTRMNWVNWLFSCRCCIQLFFFSFFSCYCFTLDFVGLFPAVITFFLDISMLDWFLTNINKSQREPCMWNVCDISKFSFANQYGSFYDCYWCAFHYCSVFFIAGHSITLSPSLSHTKCGECISTNDMKPISWNALRDKRTNATR